MFRVDCFIYTKKNNFFIFFGQKQRQILTKKETQYGKKIPNVKEDLTPSFDKSLFFFVYAKLSFTVCVCVCVCV